jgi:glycosyltransferase involved in cell wall biosynthesis
MMDNNSGVVMLLSNDFVADPRVEKEARALTEAGWHVTVLAWDREGGAAEREQRHGFLIERLGPRAEHGAGPRSLPLYRRFWSAAAERARELGPDVVHCHDMDTVSAGLAAVDGTRRRLVLDFHELYRASKVVPTSRGVGDVVRYAVDRVEARGLARADLVVLAWPSMRERYEGLFDGPIVVVDNAPDLDRFSPDDAPQTDPFRVCYIGQKRYVQSLRLLIDIVQKHPDMEALLAGGGVAASEVASYAEGKSGVRVVGRVRYEDIPGLYRGQSCVYTLYDQAVGNARIHMPVKVMEAMACGLPSLVSKDTWVGRYVADKGIGIAVDPADASVVEAALLRLKDDPGLAAEMGGRGRAIVESELNWEAAAARLTDAYEPLRHH